MLRSFYILLFVSLSGCIFMGSSGKFTEYARYYSPDSTKYLVKYDFAQGAWDGGRVKLITLFKARDSVNPDNILFNFNTLNFDSIYWKNNDTVIVEGNFTEWMSQGRSTMKDTLFNGVRFLVIHRDPIDSSFTRKIFYREKSPDSIYDLVVYKYVKPENGDYFLNISIIHTGDSIPKFGNFYITLDGYDVLENIRWDSTNALDIAVYSEADKNLFDAWLVKKRPAIKYNLQINDTISGNIKQYMQ